MIRKFIAMTLSAGALASAVWPAQPAKSGAEISLKMGEHRLTAEVVNTDETREKGLMFRTSMPDNHGMLFVFPQSSFHSMWMKNTLIPLSVAFIDDTGVILNIADMAPQTLDTHTAAGFARYALETNRGWFAKRGIKAGMKIEGLEGAPAPK